MDIQKTILNQYLLLNKKPTFKEIASDTGIQVTRVFRLFNGSTMKLSEYQIFNRKVKEKIENGFLKSKIIVYLHSFLSNARQ